MAVPHQLLDGTPPYGTKGTITLNSVVYIIEEEELTPNWSESMTRDGNGVVNRRRHLRQPYSLRLKLQLASSSTAYPPVGTTFTYAVKNETSAPTFVVRDVPENRNNEENFIESVTITCPEVVNPSALTTS